MAPNKSPRTKHDPTKKRKRDLAENDSRTKRQRADKKAAKANGSSKGKSGVVSEVPEISEALTETSPREIEIVRQFDNTDAGWRVSKPMGGRMLDIDPVITEDEQ